MVRKYSTLFSHYIKLTVDLRCGGLSMGRTMSGSVGTCCLDSSWLFTSKIFSFLPRLSLLLPRAAFSWLVFSVSWRVTFSSIIFFDSTLFLGSGMDFFLIISFLISAVDLSLHRGFSLSVKVFVSDSSLSFCNSFFASLFHGSNSSTCSLKKSC